MPPKNVGKRQRSKARTRSFDDDEASDSAARETRDRKKVRWKAKASSTAPSTKHAPSRSSRGRASTVRNTPNDADSTSSSSESEGSEEDESVMLEKVSFPQTSHICVSFLRFRLALLHSVLSMCWMHFAKGYLRAADVRRVWVIVALLSADALVLPTTIPSRGSYTCWKILRKQGILT